MAVAPLILVILAALMAGQIVAWIFLGVRAWQEARAAPFVRDALDLAAADGPPRRVSIVVPAHNEARVAARCAASILASDYPDLECVFVLDRCTDGTRAALEPIAARDPRLRILENGNCPPEWAGKCNAARLGAEATRSDLLLFTDADTCFHPSLLRASVALLRERRWDMLSLLSAPSHTHWFENVAQPVASIALLKLYPIRRANEEVDRRAFANGQFMLFERAAYDALGGHAAVKGDLLEDMGFARRMKALGMRQGVAAAAGMLGVSMYDTWSDFRGGWRRIYMECCARNPARMRRQAVQLLVTGPGMALAWGCAVALALAALVGADAEAHGWAVVVLALAGAALAVGKAAQVGLYRACSVPAWTVLFFTVGCAAVAAIFLRGARDLERRAPVRWGGREYVLEPTNH
jgi:hypothetical protein